MKIGTGNTPFEVSVTWPSGGSGLPALVEKKKVPPYRSRGELFIKYWYQPKILERDIGALIQPWLRPLAICSKIARKIRYFQPFQGTVNVF